MDEKDRTIERQMEKIREMTQRNLRRMADDIWGAVGPLKEEPQKADKPAAPDMRDEVLEKQLEVIRRLSENGARTVTDKLWDNGYLSGLVDEHMAVTGQVTEQLSEHQCEGFLEAYLLTGRHGICR